MKRFEERWRECVRVARGVPADENLGVPSWEGIVARRARIAASEAAPEAEALAWWRWYGARGVLAATAMVVVCWFLAFRASDPVHPLRPGVENAVAEIFWLL